MGEAIRLYAGTVAGVALAQVIGRAALGQELGVGLVAQSVVFALLFGTCLVVIHRRNRDASPG